MQIVNPILPGFHADPCICRKNDDYYIAVSSFEWFPGIPVYHSKDMKHWELYANVITDEAQCDLKGLPSAKGIWAPCLTYCKEEDLFYVVYGVMHSMNARYFDVDNFVITAKDIRGLWSDPVYLHSSGFDASMLHDDDGRKWVVALDWETRPGYEKPGQICIVEYDPEKKAICGIPKRIWRGATQRGCLEAPHLTKRNGWYYLMCAEGGTGYYHGVTLARSRNPMGPYEGCPFNPIITSVSENYDERADVDHLKPRYYNPEVYLQKSGHGSYVETSLGETYLVHLCSRPFLPELRCSLGRETAIQKMEWTEDGWLRMADGGNLAQTLVEGSALPDWEPSQIPEMDDFDSVELGIQYYAPRISPQSFCDLESRPGWLRMRGQEAGTSQNRVSLLARKLTSVNAEMITKLEFTPEVYQQSAGLIFYYDNMNYAYLRKYYSETLGCPAISVQHVKNGDRIEYENARCVAPTGPLWMKLCVHGREVQFSWSDDGSRYENIGPVFDTSEFSDEYSQFGEFTGCFAGITCADRMTHLKYADFDFLFYKNLETDLLLDEYTRRCSEDHQRTNCPDQSVVKQLEKLPYWQHLSNEQKELAKKQALIRHYAQGELLDNSEDSCLGMIYVLQGELRIYLLSEEGREVSLYRLFPGELGVLSANGVLSHVSYETQLSAMQETDLLILPDKLFSELTQQNVYLRSEVYALAVQRMSLILWDLQQIIFARMDQRVASFLLESSERSGTKELLITQEQIAEYINSAREVVARMLKEFAMDGLIENRRGSILLLDISGLKKICGNCVYPRELAEELPSEA